MYFQGFDVTNGYQLWKSDGTEGGTNLVTVTGFDFYFGPQYFVVFNNKLYFQGYDSFNGNQLWMTDGTDLGTSQVTTVDDGFASNFLQSMLTVFNGALYFTGHDSVHGNELWKSDGTVSGTQMLKDICPSTCDGLYVPIHGGLKRTACAMEYDAAELAGNAHGLE